MVMVSLRLAFIWLASLSLLLIGNLASAAPPSEEEAGQANHGNTKSSTRSGNGSTGGAHNSGSVHSSPASVSNESHTSNVSTSGAHSPHASSGVNASDYSQNSESNRHNVEAASQQSPGSTSGPSESDRDRFRIKRDYTPRLYGNAEVKHHYYPPSGAAPMMMNQPAAYAPMQNVPTDQGQYGTVNTFTPPPPVMQAQGNYIWEQSANGGYYDATGQFRGLVMGDQLYRYGGKFPDGTAVPTTPVVCNFQGHVYLPYVVKR